MILAFHAIWSAYGFWLPNEPRGSWSDFVASWELFRYGPATKVDTRRSIAKAPYDRSLKRDMQQRLRHPPVVFTGEQAKVIGTAFGDTPYTLHALAVMPDHVHAVIAHTPRDIRRMVGHLKGEATRAMRRLGWFTDRTPWVEHGWNVYLDTDHAVERAVGYVAGNPTREGLRPQRWSCVVPYDPARSRAAEARRKRRG